MIYNIFECRLQVIYSLDGSISYLLPFHIISLDIYVSFPIHNIDDNSAH